LPAEFGEHSCAKRVADRGEVAEVVWCDFGARGRGA
jgi:hypothetical protein